MPPKPQVFKSPDGKEFTTKKEWRDYMMATFYSFKNRVSETLIKAPGDIDGQMFDIADCDNVTIIIMDNCEQIQIDQVKNSRIFIGSCASSIFIRNCENNVFYTCCRQLRLREVTNSKFFIYSMSEVHIEYSNTLKFGCFNGGYPEHSKHLSNAGLDISHNLWYDIFDHNDPSKSNSNWSLIPDNEYEEPWYPQGSPCEHAIPLSKPGSVVKVVEESSMQSFNFQQLVKDSQTVSSGSPPKKSTIPDSNVTKEPEISSVVLSDEDIVKKIITQYGNYKAGDILAEIVSPNFVTILPNGISLTLDLLSAAIPGGNIQEINLVSVSASKDLAWASFWIGNISGGYVKCTAILEKNQSNEWKLVYVQRSDIAQSII